MWKGKDLAAGLDFDYIFWTRDCFLVVDYLGLAGNQWISADCRGIIWTALALLL